MDAKGTSILDSGKVLVALVMYCLGNITVLKIFTLLSGKNTVLGIFKR